ncbi:hypothetical protein DYB31_012092 [Aphanomyces astaci]|uniref:Uncharacterized protein n=1 Tax=Aphanomyces astaci TaxID=112090 RepID=A0A397FMC6_APHAT|nr:hypothetical protein DYB31_012092 [Aphanomyces astaci]
MSLRSRNCYRFIIASHRHETVGVMMDSTSAYQISLEPDRDDAREYIIHSTESSPFLDYDTLLHHTLLSSSSDPSAVQPVDLTSPSVLHHDLFHAFDDVHSYSSSPCIIIMDVPLTGLDSPSPPYDAALQPSLAPSQQPLPSPTDHVRRLELVEPFNSITGFTPTKAPTVHAPTGWDDHLPTPRTHASFHSDGSPVALTSHDIAASSMESDGPSDPIHHHTQLASDLLACLGRALHMTSIITRTSTLSTTHPSHSFISVEWVLDQPEAPWPAACCLYGMTFELADKDHAITTIGIPLQSFVSSSVRVSLYCCHV